MKSNRNTLYLFWYTVVLSKKLGYIGVLSNDNAVRCAQIKTGSKSQLIYDFTMTLKLN